MKKTNINEMAKFSTLTKKRKVSSRKVESSMTIKTNPSGVSGLIKGMTVSSSVGRMSATENGALSLASTGSKVLDFFSVGAALKSKSDAEVISLFKTAYSDNPLLAMKALFWVRDIRGGQGVRKTFKTLLRWLANNHKEVVLANLENIPLFGRWDDLFELFGTPVEKDMMVLVNNQLAKDLASEEGVSLLAKWMPSENASSKESRNKAIKFAKFMECSQRNYRKVLSFLRGKINIVERSMCSKDWSSIDYEKVPSRASMIYRKAFGKNDKDRYAGYLSSVEKGEAKINSSVIYPHELVSKVKYGSDRTIEAQWNNLPNYLEGNEGNRLVVADVSGSMSGEPIDVCVALSIYLAERNTGMFKDYFITFSNSPSLQKVSGSSLFEKVSNLCRAQWDMSTNIQAVFDLILNTAKKNKVSKKEMPKEILILSDMQFNEACRGNDRTNFQEIERKYEDSGYKRPTLVFWNLRASLGNSPVSKDQNGAVLVSGYSPSLMKDILSGKNYTPLTAMLDILNKPRYSVVVA